MYIHVRLLNGFPELLLYHVPLEMSDQNLIGALVRVPLKNRVESAWVVHRYSSKPDHITFAIKDAISIEHFPQDIHYMPFIHRLASYYCVEPLIFIKRIRHFISQKEIEVELPDQQPPFVDQERQLTDEQQTVSNYLIEKLHAGDYAPTLLHGVTGSGKTEVYKRLIQEAITLHKSVILMLPEVTLALQFEKLLRMQLPTNIPIFGFHSATSAPQKRLLWQMLKEAKPALIIGVHLPVLLPMTNLGLIIIDEEHEVGYQEKKYPKINSKEAALIKAHQNNIPIILGSATPSLSSLHNVQTKGWKLFELKKRFAGAFPTIKIVQLTDKKQRRNFWISTELERAIKDRLSKKEQTIIFLNRRGYSFFVQCKNCSHIFGCPSCSVSLTLHEDNSLNCHYCSFSQSLPPTCPSCKQSEDQFIKKGVGTQQAVLILQKLFPEARIARADLDMTLKKKAWQQTMNDMHEGNIDILVGTQTITKGYHFPKVTLVGILWADLNLHFPMYNASETTLQQLIQVAGRAGRQSNESLVVVQAMADHPVFHYINEIDYRQFYDWEMQKRAEVNYPPCIRFVELEMRHENELILEQESERIVNQAQNIVSTHNLEITVLGPAKPPVHKIKNMQSRKIYLKSPHLNQLIQLFNTLQKMTKKVQLSFTPNPLQ